MTCANMWTIFTTFSGAASKCTGAAMFSLGWLTVAALHQVVPHFLARLFPQTYHPQIQRAHPYYHSSQFFIQCQGSGKLWILCTSESSHRTWKKQWKTLGPSALALHNTVKPLFYNCSQKQANVISKEGWSCWLEHQTRDQKVASSNPSRSEWRIFLSVINVVCWL